MFVDLNVAEETESLADGASGAELASGEGHRHLRLHGWGTASRRNYTLRAKDYEQELVTDKRQS